MPSKEVSFWNVSELVIALMSVRTLSSRLITAFREDCVPFSTLFSSVRLVPSCVRILFNCSVVAGTPFSIPFSSPVRLEKISIVWFNCGNTFSSREVRRLWIPLKFALLIVSNCESVLVVVESALLIPSFPAVRLLINCWLLWFCSESFARAELIVLDCAGNCEASCCSVAIISPFLVLTSWALFKAFPTFWLISEAWPDSLPNPSEAWP